MVNGQLTGIANELPSITTAIATYAASNPDVAQRLQHAYDEFLGKLDPGDVVKSFLAAALDLTEAAMEERIVTADPVADPQGYQREMLALLGGQDPVAVLAATPLAVRDQTAGLPQDHLTRRPAPREWSAAELLGHLWDSEIAYSFRARAILAQDEPRLIGYDQDAWAALARPAFAELLAAFAALRTANLALIGQTPRERWERFGLHEERGRLSFRLLTETTAGHDCAHLKQLAQTIAAVRG